MWKQKTKYSNFKIDRSGRSFGSKLEASVFDILMLRQAANEGRFLRQQVRIQLTKAKIVYIPDFECLDKEGNIIYVEAKGYETPEWRIKKRLWEHYGPAPLEIWQGSHTNPRLTETIIPKLTNTKDV